MRENAEQKGRRYLCEGRLIVRALDEAAASVRADVRGAGAVYTVSRTRDAGWRCSCPARGTCAHLTALQLVVALGKGLGVNLRVELPPDVLEQFLADVTTRVLSQLGATERGSQYLTIPEAAELLRCRRHRIDDLLSQGKLHRVKDGRRTLIARDDIDRYLAART